jgi:YHS domain-containing protein
LVRVGGESRRPRRSGGGRRGDRADRFKNIREPVRLFRVVPRGTVGGRLDIDPVCHMVLGEDREIGSLTYHGRRFRFCSLECARQFASDPELFVDDR